MDAVSPVIMGHEAQEIVLAKDQEQYTPLPILRFNLPSGPCVSRWRLTAEELAAIMNGADIVLTQLIGQGTPEKPVYFHPVHLQVVMPEDHPILVG